MVESPEGFRTTIWQDIDLIKTLRKQLNELQEIFVSMMGKSIYTPEEVETLTNLLAILLYKMKTVLPSHPAIDEFWEYWNEPGKFIENHPEHCYYIIEYEKGGKRWATPVKKRSEIAKKQKELRLRQYKLVDVKVMPSPELLRELLELINEAASKTGLVSIRLPVMNRPLLFPEEEGERFVLTTVNTLEEEMEHALYGGKRRKGH